MLSFMAVSFSTTFRWGGRAGAGSGGKAAQSTKQEENAFMAKNVAVYALIVGLIDL
jgi:hypothetical protein